MTTIGGRAGRYVPESDWLIALMDQLFRAIERLWCWREFSVPLAAVLIAYKTHHPGLALSAATLMVCVVVLLLLTRPRILLRALRRCRARSRALSRQIAWPRVSRDLGWARRLEKGGWLVPDLVSWSENDRQVTVQVRPLPEHGARSWDQMADALRRLVAGATVQWRESHGILTVVISRVALPASLLWLSGLSDSERVVIGQRHGGRLLALDVLRTPHLLLAGATGSGKGGAIRAAIAGALEGGWQAVVLDPKESGEYRWLDRLAVPVFATIGEQVCALEVIEGIRERRQSLIKQYGVDHYRQLPSEVRADWRPVLLVVDEAADLLVPVKGRSEPQREYAALQHRAATLIAQLARKGRSAGLHLIVSIQRPDTAQLGDGGGALRNNLTARLALGSLDAEGIRMLGVPSGDAIASTLDGTPGRGICVGFGDDPRASACQVAWLEQQDAVSEVRLAAAQGLGAIEPLRDPDERDEEREGEEL
jgi:FtsK/SpoIIIE family